MCPDVALCSLIQSRWVATSNHCLSTLHFATTEVLSCIALFFKRKYNKYGLVITALVTCPKTVISILVSMGTGRMIKYSAHIFHAVISVISLSPPQKTRS